MDYNNLLLKTILKTKEQDINIDVSEVYNALDIKTLKILVTYENLHYYLQIGYDERRKTTNSIDKYDFYVVGHSQTIYINNKLVDYVNVQTLYQELYRLHRKFHQLYSLSKKFSITTSELVFRFEEFEVIKFNGNKNKVDYISLRNLFDYYNVKYNPFLESNEASE